MSLDFRKALKEAKDPSKQEKEMSVEVDKLSESLSACQEQLSEKESLIEKLKYAQEDLELKNLELSESLEKLEKFKAGALEKEAERKAEARKAEVSKYLSADKVGSFLESVESLDDKAFSVVVGSLKKNYEEEQSSEYMQEVGYSAGSQDEFKEEHVSNLMKFIEESKKGKES